jgi:cation transport regulator ChaC
MWIFGYGSLIFRPSFTFLERRRAWIRGYVRRFWQGSPDHRGLPDAPGRVVTLIEDATANCGGCAYRIDPNAASAILDALDLREQAGFERRLVPLADGPGGPPFAEGIMWIAGEANHHFLGPLPEAAIAAYVRDRRGPSGTNANYVLRLLEALRALDVVDAHVEEIARHLRELSVPERLELGDDR